MKRKNITLKKMSLHDEHHHSFVFGLNTDALLKMMTSMTAQHYFEKHGEYPSRLKKKGSGVENTPLLMYSSLMS